MSFEHCLNITLLNNVSTFLTLVLILKFMLILFRTAIETTFGENVLNSGYLMERPGAYHRLNSIINYERTGMLERIQIKGPISKDIKVMVSC